MLWRRPDVFVIKVLWHIVWSLTITYNISKLRNLISYFFVLLLTASNVNGKGNDFSRAYLSIILSSLLNL